jgi:hypothetical protein
VQLLAQRVRARQTLQLRDHLGVAAQVQIGVDAHFQRL